MPATDRAGMNLANRAEISCNGKEPLTRERAGKVENDMRRRHPDRAISAYRCQHCGNWHVGTRTKRRLPRVRQDEDDNEQEEA